MKTLLEFNFAKHKETERRLGLLKKVLEKDGLRVDEFFKESKRRWKLQQIGRALRKSFRCSLVLMH